MESVIIAAPCAYDLELKTRLEQLGPVGIGAAGVVFIEDGRSRVYVTRNDAVGSELEPERLKLITSTIREPIFYTIDFSDIAFCRKVLSAIADDPRLLVDNDHGVLLTGDEFVRVLRSQTDWDWRMNAP
jgi:hypothetical protein